MKKTELHFHGMVIEGTVWFLNAQHILRNRHRNLSISIFELDFLGRGGNGST